MILFLFLRWRVCIVVRVCGVVVCVCVETYRNSYFGPNHPMKPARLVMTHHLVMSYKLNEKMEIYVRVRFE